jgi:Xaa-Pro aminopeptidase
MYAIRMARSNDHVTKGKFYKVTQEANGKIRIADDNLHAFEIAARANYWWLTEMPERHANPNYKECFERFQHAQSAGDAVLNGYIRDFEHANRTRSLIRKERDEKSGDRPFNPWAPGELNQLTEETPTMTKPIKIEDTKLIDGTLLSDHSPDSIIRLIQKERKALDVLNDLKIASKYVVAKRAIHTSNIQKLVEILDTFADDLDAQA